MANNDSATPITTGSVTSSLKQTGIYYFKLDPEHFLYKGEGEDEQRLCGLTGAEIDSNFHFLSGMDIKDVKIADSGSTIVITRVNDTTFSAMTLNLADIRPEFRFDKETGVLYVTYPDGEEKIADGFFVDFNDEGKYDVKIYTDGTLDGIGTMYSPLSLSRLERTGFFAPVETLVEDGDIEAYKGRRILTKELIDDYGHLYSYDEVEAIQSALTKQQSPWRVATKQDWDELLNAMEQEEGDRNHDDCDVDRREEFHGFGAGDMLKSTKHWRMDGGIYTDENEHEYVGFGVLPVGVRPYRANLITDEENDIEGFGELSAFWAIRSSADTCPDGDPFVKIFSKGFGGVAQKRPDEDDAYSVRLVKECEPGCPEQYETILGSSYPVGPITSPCGVEYCKIWTLSNLYSKGNGFSGLTISGTNVPPQTEYAYFITECDGRKKRLMEGESVVILDRDDHEHRIINGELVDIDEKVTNDIKAAVGELSSNTITAMNILENRMSEQVTSLSSGTATEVSRLDAEIDETGELLNDRIDTVVSNIESTISAVTEDFNGKIDSINEELQEINDALSAHTAAIEENASFIGAEASRAIAAEDDINSRIDSLSADTENLVSEKVNELNESIEGLSTRSESMVGGIASDLTTLSSSTVALSEALSDTTDALYGLEDRMPVAISEGNAATLAQANEYTDGKVNEINATKVNDLYFDSLSKYIKLIKADGSLSDGIPAEDFLKDSVLTRVEYDEGNERLVFVWNDDDTTRTYIPLTKLSNVYGIANDSLAYLKMSGTNLSAIVDKADGFEKTLATTKFVEDIASAMTAVIAELTEANNENREDIDTLNGDKSVAGSIRHTIEDRFVSDLIPGGPVITTTTLDDANNSLLRVISVDGERKYYVSNDAKDMKATDANGRPVVLNTYLNTLEDKVAALEAENAELKERVARLEQQAGNTPSSFIDEAAVKDIIKNYLSGVDREIKVSESGNTLQIGFADDAVFGFITQ